jgi:predicted RNA-binding Zn ribbon-like protein
MSKESRKFKVPDEVANLYDFANSLDLRHFTHNNVRHVQGDDLAGPRDLAAWMSERGLAKSDAKIAAPMFDAAIALRTNLRAYLQCDPIERSKTKDVVRSLNLVVEQFPLIAEISNDGGMKLRPARNDALAGLSAIVAELHNGSANGALSRLKMCASDECRRVFFDRSKPGSRRWCVSTLCGNRMKTRTYRQRHQTEA